MLSRQKLCLYRRRNRNFYHSDQCVLLSQCDTSRLSGAVFPIFTIRGRNVKKQKDRKYRVMHIKFKMLAKKKSL